MTIVITVEPHPYFKREERNLVVEVPITVPEAILARSTSRRSTA